MNRRGLARSAVCALACSACHEAATPVARHSSSIAISPDGEHVYVANADADSVSVINASTSVLESVIPLGAAPSPDAGGRFTPAVEPRALALAPRAGRLFVTGERSGALYAIDLATEKLTWRTNVGSEPIGVVLSSDETNAYVACSGEGTVVRVEIGTGRVTATARTSRKPWSLSWSGDDSVLIATHLLGPGVSVIEPRSMAVTGNWIVPDGPSLGDPRLANGEVRGLYDAEVRPGTHELWVAHLMLATGTAQPALDFETSVFPALSVLDDNGVLEARLTTDAADVPGIDGAFGDVVSGPHAFEFTRDGRFALLVDTSSEDVLVVDAVKRVESALLRPLPGHMPEGIVLSPDDRHAYVDERNTGDVAVLDLDAAGESVRLQVSTVIPRYPSDPMPAQLRLGQHLFFSANSDELPITRNHWMSCASCHLEGRSDAVTWRFAEGPRDTPSNAGGTADTGFLLRTAARRSVQDYWQTINEEQGGRFSPTNPTQAAQLAALAAYVDRAIPVPVPPQTDPDLVAEGRALFERPDVGCSGCHSGPARTDSGAGNPALNLGGPIRLHDVGTCDLAGPFPDVRSTDTSGHLRTACEFDTPALRGLDDSAPYLHDGSAPTLLDVLEQTRGTMGHVENLSEDELSSVVEYLRSL